MSDFNETVLFPLTDQEFNQISTLIYNQFGINLTDKKNALVRGRLNKVLHNHNCSSFSQYLNMVKTDTTGVILAELVDRISTNHTYFYREPEHFSFLMEQALPEVLKLPQVEEDQEIRRIKVLVQDSPDLINAGWPATPLQQAAENGQLKVAEFLLANGAQADACGQGANTLFQRFALEGEGQFRPLRVGRLGNTPGDGTLIGNAHNQASFAGHKSRGNSHTVLSSKFFTPYPWQNARILHQRKVWSKSAAPGLRTEGQSKLAVEDKGCYRLSQRGEGVW